MTQIDTRGNSENAVVASPKSVYVYIHLKQWIVRMTKTGVSVSRFGLLKSGSTNNESFFETLFEYTDFTIYRGPDVLRTGLLS